MIIYGDLSLGPVRPDWYANLEAIRLDVLNEKEYGRYHEEKAAGQGLPPDLWAACRLFGAFPCDHLGGRRSIFSAAMGSLPLADTTVRRSEILIRVADWHCDNHDRTSIAVSSEEFRTPVTAWDEGGESSPMENLRLAPDRIFEWLGWGAGGHGIHTDQPSLFDRGYSSACGCPSSWIRVPPIQRSVRGCPSW